MATDRYSYLTNATLAIAICGALAATWFPSVSIPAVAVSAVGAAIAIAAYVYKHAADQESVKDQETEVESLVQAELIAPRTEKIKASTLPATLVVYPTYQILDPEGLSELTALLLSNSPSRERIASYRLALQKVKGLSVTDVGPTPRIVTITASDLIQRQFSTRLKSRQSTDEPGDAVRNLILGAMRSPSRAIH